ncbi:neprilysin-1-like [Ixodes scapularis]|nr:neprilysin-1-like [Ixodes scapularis]
MMRSSHTHWDSSGKKVLLKAIGFLCLSLFVVVVILLLVSLLRISTSRNDSFATCRSPSCSRYSHLVNHSLNPVVKPCDNFYQHVCHGWTRDHLGSVMAEQYLDHVTVLLRKTSPQLKNQSPLEKVAKLFQSCEEVLAQSEESASMADIMRGTLLEWPSPSSNPDVLQSITRLQIKLNLSILLVIEKRYYENHTAVLLWPCDQVLKMKRRREKIIRYSNYEEYHGKFRDHLAAPHDVGLQSFEEFSKVEAAVFRYLGDQFYRVDAVTVFSLAGLANLTYHVSLERWRTLFETELGLVTGQSLKIHVGSVQYLMAFNSLLAEQGDRAVHLYLGWALVQLLSPYTWKRFAVLYHFGDLGAALQSRPWDCLQLTEMLLGWTLFAHQAKLKPDPEVANDTRDLVESVYGSLRGRISSSDWLGPFMNRLPAKLGVTHDYQDSALEAEASALIELPNLNSIFLDNWIEIVRYARARNLSFLKLSRTDQVRYIAPGKSWPPFSVHDGAILMPTHSLTLPTYDPLVPPAVKFGALGSLIADGVFSLLLDKVIGHPAPEKALLRRLSCYQKHMGRHGNQMIKAYRAASLTFLWDAFNETTSQQNKTRLVGLRDYNQEQTFFLALCYLLCSRDDPSDAEALCNEPLMANPTFAEVFSCTDGSSMTSRDSTCLFP